jgi:hypothetical protein
MKGTIPSRQACYVWLVIFLTMLSDVFGRLTRITMPSPRPRQVREVDAHAMLTLRSRCTVAASVEPGDENSLFIIPQIDVRCRQLLQRSLGNERSTCLLVPKLDAVAGRLDERSGSAISSTGSCLQDTIAKGRCFNEE